MIQCKALAEQSMFVTAKGDILPCCYMYRGGPELNNGLKQIIKEENFQGLVDSWNSPNPYSMCKIICDDSSNHPESMKKFEGQWKNKAPIDKR
jgi:hypothetical protein